LYGQVHQEMLPDQSHTMNESSIQISKHGWMSVEFVISLASNSEALEQYRQVPDCCYYESSLVTIVLFLAFSEV
jgi:hypothetical protein